MAIELRYRVVDVFTPVPLAGNALCVVLDPCPEPVMAAIAREVNLSETAFPVLTGEHSYEVRIFTPTTELPFAGHPSLGTAWALGPGRWSQKSEAATVVVEADPAGAVMTQPDPVFSEVVDPAPAVLALGLPGAVGASLAEAAGMRHLLVATDVSLEGLIPDPPAIAAVTRGVGAATLAVARRLDQHTLHARVFAPAAGVNEDPGTGSVAGPLAVLARQTWGTDQRVTILQGAEVGRPCHIEVDTSGDRLQVGGRVAGCAEGRFTL